MVGLHVLVWALVLWATSPDGDCTKSGDKRAGIGDVIVVRTDKDGDVYEAPLRNPVTDVPAITICPMPQPQYREPVKVKPRSKRGQRQRTWKVGQ